MRKIRIGAPDYVSSRPLIYGLRTQRPRHVELSYGEPGELATALEQNRLDVALVPSIEYLRGVGEHIVAGPAIVVRGRTGGVLLATNRPIDEIERIAVAENSRTPVAVLRILLDKAYGTLPDFCVFKNDPDLWRENFDAVLLTGDRGLDYCMRKLQDNETCHDVGEMWCSLFPAPLVLSLWLYNDEALGPQLGELLTQSRDAGMRELSLLADELARTTSFDSRFLYDYLSRGWSYAMGAPEEAGLKLLEDHALEYQLIQKRRLSEIHARQV